MSLALFAASSLALPAVVPYNVTAGSSCALVQDYLIDGCTCTDTETLGAQLACPVAIPSPLGGTLDTIKVMADIEPCAAALHMGMEVIEDAAGIDYKQDILLGVDQKFPVPDLAIDVPGLGSAGVFMYVTLDGNVANLTLSVSTDVCASLVGIETCGATYSPTYFPIPIITKATISFDDVCSGKAKKEAKMVEYALP